MDTPLDLNLNESKLKRVKSIRFLGVYIEEKLNWQCHINILVRKLSRSTGILYNIGRCLPYNLRSSVFNALINSHIFMLFLYGVATQLNYKIFLHPKKRLLGHFFVSKVLG